jgi:hypothetical protein
MLLQLCLETMDNFFDVCFNTPNIGAVSLLRYLTATMSAKDAKQLRFIDRNETRLVFSHDLTTVTYIMPFHRPASVNVATNIIMNECKIYYYEFISDIPHWSIVGACCSACLLKNDSRVFVQDLHNHVCVSSDTVYAGSHAVQEHHSMGRHAKRTIGILFDLRSSADMSYIAYSRTLFPQLTLKSPHQQRGKMYVFLDGHPQGLLAHNIGLNLQLGITLYNISQFTLKIKQNARVPNEAEWTNVSNEDQQKSLYCWSQGYKSVHVCSKGRCEAIF